MGKNKIGVETVKLVAERLNGATSAELARKYNTSRENIYYRTKRYMQKFQKYFNKDALIDFRKRRIDIYDATEHMLIDQMHNPKKLNKASINHLASAVAHVNNIKRLENDQSTENINIVHNTVKLINKYTDELEYINKKLKEPDGDIGTDNNNSAK